MDATCFLQCDHRHLHTGLTFADRILLRNGSASQYRSSERDSEATSINPVKPARGCESKEQRLGSGPKGLGFAADFSEA